MEVRMFTVTVVAENTYLIRGDDSSEALLIDPGGEGPVIVAQLQELGVELKAILLTHTHWDHIGAVAEIARATAAPVYCPEKEKQFLLDPPPSSFFPDMKIEGYEADKTVSGGEKLSLAGFRNDFIPNARHKHR